VLPPTALNIFLNARFQIVYVPALVPLPNLNQKSPATEIVEIWNDTCPKMRIICQWSSMLQPFYQSSFSGNCLRSKGITPEGMYDLEPHESGKMHTRAVGQIGYDDRHIDVILHLVMISALHRVFLCLCMFYQIIKCVCVYSHAPNQKWFSIFIVLMSYVIWRFSQISVGARQDAPLVSKLWVRQKTLRGRSCF